MMTEKMQCKNLTPKEAIERMVEAGRLLQVWMDAYIRFPNKENFEGVEERMIEYQTAWMHRMTMLGEEPSASGNNLEY